MPDNKDTYYIVVTKVNKKPEIETIYKNGNPMTSKHAPKVETFFKQNQPDAELEDGCVGLGVAYENQCQWVWGWWW